MYNNHFFTEEAIFSTLSRATMRPPIIIEAILAGAYI